MATFLEHAKCRGGSASPPMNAQGWRRTTTKSVSVRSYMSSIDETHPRERGRLLLTTGRPSGDRAAANRTSPMHDGQSQPGQKTEARQKVSNFLKEQVGDERTLDVEGLKHLLGHVPKRRRRPAHLNTASNSCCGS
jgi:hypothetical protein